MRYRVEFVDDSALPEGVEWAFAQQAGRTHLFVKQPAIDTAAGECPVLSRAWACWQAAARNPQPPRIRSEAGRIRVLTAVLLAAYGVPAMKAGSAIL